MSLEEAGRRNRGGDDRFFSLPGCCLAIGIFGVVGAVAIPNLIEARS